MNLFEIAVRDLPKTADKAEIRWSTSEGPRREGKEIVLRLADNMHFMPVLSGKQFICGYPGDSAWWFGGTDENPFLTRLDHNNEDVQEGIQEIADNRGEERFFQSLRPEGLDELESLFENRAHRQGDIFALETAWNRIEFEKMSKLIGLEFEIYRESIEEERIFETRHTVSGFVVQTYLLRSRRYYNSRDEGTRTTLAEGILRAPDHEFLKLNKVHALFQASGLFDPRKAD